MNNQFIPTINHFVALIKFKQSQKEINELEKIADLIVEKLKLKVVNKFTHTFKPQGKTLIYILAESHLALHSWPEHNLIHIDLLSCNKLERKVFEKTLNLIFKKNCQISYKGCSLQ